MKEQHNQRGRSIEPQASHTGLNGPEPSPAELMELLVEVAMEEQAKGNINVRFVDEAPTIHDEPELLDTIYE